MNEHQRILDEFKLFTLACLDNYKPDSNMNVAAGLSLSETATFLAHRKEKEMMQACAQKADELTNKADSSVDKLQLHKDIMKIYEAAFKTFRQENGLRLP